LSATAAPDSKKGKIMDTEDMYCSYSAAVLDDKGRSETVNGATKPYRKNMRTPQHTNQPKHPNQIEDVQRSIQPSQIAPIRKK
jgi:hypothetical protein